jgi:hypothetical protein
MTPPPTKADDRRDPRSHARAQGQGYVTPPRASLTGSGRASTDGRRVLDGRRAFLTRKLRTPLVFLLVFVALLLTHLTLLRLPYYWDEAGYFIPAARDIYTDGSFVPHSTLSNAHPPLVMTYLALAWKFFGFRIAVARVAMLAVAALALAGVHALAARVANARVAIATVLCTALYPVFFAQSSLAHLDMMVAALTMWGLVFYLPPLAGMGVPEGETGGRVDATPSSNTTPLQDDTTSPSHNTTSSSNDTTSLQGDTTSLQDDITLLQDSTALLQVNTTLLQNDTTSSSRAATSLQDDAITLRAHAERLKKSEKAHFRRALCIFLFALAALAKETAVLVPLTLCGWELLCLLSGKNEKLAVLVCLERRRTVWWSLALLVACVPLALWFAYHRAHTGYTFGNPEYFRYNVESTLNLARMFDAGWRRLEHITYYMNLWALTLAGLAAMFLKPRRDGSGDKRTRIAVPVQLVFAALVLAHVVALSVVGGAVLARYMLPVLPLVIMIWVSTIWRRVRVWPLVLALVCGAFVYRLEVNPSYSFPWEENLAYRDFILLHRDAARFLEDRYAAARVLTSWPATDELKNPYYGYLERPLRVFAVEDFKRETLEQAARQNSEYDTALLYSTHGGLELRDAARVLGGRLVFWEERKGQWVAVIEKQ